ncbi:MAG: FKBP-type peptidyl-prolyl cis-trans isomerase [Chloroflexota bacterium]|nr:FKBP-type peptidyl-prolyl cis-trans isomerase [Chloroflexota bacterium]
MAQTSNEQKRTAQKLNRPGQRQQERLMRLARRRRQQQIWTSIIVALVVIAVAGIGFWQYQQHLAAASQSSSTNTGSKNNTPATVGPPCAVASSLPSVYASKPSAGPTNPPQVSDTPKTGSDGLQCIDLKVGNGAVAQNGSTVSAQYTGWLAADGKKFDSSYDHGGQPFQVALGQGKVIPGWDKGLVGMKVGGTRRLIIPAALGYGAQGSPPVIPSNATLVFDITLVSIP